MSEVMRKLDDDEPLILAYKAWQETPEYANSLHWAKHTVIANFEDDERLKIEHPHVEGSLWAAFLSGWNAREAQGKTGDTK